jgi:ADP-heptose:LPS heptosyltransferase
MKILIIRFSSIGDIVLTTPIVRCVKEQIPQAEVHFLCKPPFAEIVATNPYIQKIHLFDVGTWNAASLQSENFDYIIDLQNNYRSRKLCRKFKLPHAHFPKLNVQKWLLVNFKINKLPNIHVVDRYFKATQRLPAPIKNDGQGLDFFLNDADYEKINACNIPQDFVAIAMGSRHKTKQLPLPMLVEICKKINIPVVLLGDVNDIESADYICSQVEKNIINLCGKLSLRESAACIDLSKTLLCGDTGLMHIAAALDKPIVSVWGNTVPAFGMYPYMPQHPDRYHIIENKNLRCRPCSKLGFEKCPKKHFKCMREVDVGLVVEYLD